MHTLTKKWLTRFLFSGNLKKWIKVIFCVAWLVLPTIYFWGNSTVCTAVEVEEGAEFRLTQSENYFPVTTMYEYTHRSQSYAVDVTKAFSSQEKGKHWMANNPIGSEVECLVDFNNPEKITVVPLGFPFIRNMLDLVLYPAYALLLLMVFCLMKKYFPFGFTFGPQVYYRTLSDPELDKRIRIRYQAKIANIRELGFQDFCFYSEILPKYSAIWSFFEYLGMRWFREVTEIQFPLRVTLQYPLLRLPGKATYASISAEGVCFYTRLNNGIGILTGTLKHTTPWKFYDHKEKIQVRTSVESVADTWISHQEQIEDFQREGITVSKEESFGDFADISAKRDKSVFENDHWFG